MIRRLLPWNIFKKKLKAYKNKIIIMKKKKRRKKNIESLLHIAYFRSNLCRHTNPAIPSPSSRHGGGI